jgi:hypothetical protein
MDNFIKEPLGVNLSIDEESDSSMEIEIARAFEH